MLFDGKSPYEGFGAAAAGVEAETAAELDEIYSLVDDDCDDSEDEASR